MCIMNATDRKLFEIDRRQIVGTVNEACAVMIPYIRSKLGDRKWFPKVTTSFSLYRTRSWGGVRDDKPFISLHLTNWLGSLVGTYHEYAQFKDDPEIGEIDYCERRQGIYALVAHELAHAAQWSLILGVTKGYNVEYAHGGLTDRGHGALWQEIYRDLRNNFVNGEKYMENVEIAQTTKPVKPVKEKKLTNRTRVFNLVQANAGKTTIELVAMVMQELKVTKANAYTYVYHARKAG